MSTRSRTRSQRPHGSAPTMSRTSPRPCSSRARDGRVSRGPGKDRRDGLEHADVRVAGGELDEVGGRAVVEELQRRVERLHADLGGRHPRYAGRGLGARRLGPTLPAGIAQEGDGTSTRVRSSSASLSCLWGARERFRALHRSAPGSCGRLRARLRTVSSTRVTRSSTLPAEHGGDAVEGDLVTGVLRFHQGLHSRHLGLHAVRHRLEVVDVGPHPLDVVLELGLHGVDLGVEPVDLASTLWLAALASSRAWSMR